MEKRRMAGLLLLMAMSLFIIMPSAVIATEGEDLGARGAEIFDKMIALGVLQEDEGYMSGENMSRSVFTRLTMKLGGYAPAVVDAQDTAFADVGGDAPDASYIAAAYEMGYIGGDRSGNFYPENTITCAEAVKLISGVLGYGLYAEESGGYPSGYLMVASRLRLLPGMELAADTPLTWDDAMVMLDHASNADLMEIIKVGDTVKMHTVPGQTALTQRFSIYHTEALMEANEYTDLLSPYSTVGTGVVLAGGIAYQTGKTDAAECLGMRMQLYYYAENDSDMRELRYAAPAKNSNEILEISLEDVIRLDGNRLQYADKTGRARTAVLDKKATLIWNGKMAELREEKLLGGVGNITLISYDGDLAYDVVRVMQYTSYVISATSENTGVVNTKQGVKLLLDEKNRDYGTILKKEGQRVNFNTLKEGQVLSYAESEDIGRQVKTAIVSEKTLTGAVDEVGTAENSLVIGGRACRTTEEIARRVTPGSEGTFYFDAFDRVVYLGGTLDIVYGYLNGLQVRQFDKVFCRIFTENNRWVTLKMKDKINYNGQSAAAVDVAAQLGKNADEYRQMIRYLVNAEGELSTLDTAKEVIMGSDEDKTAIEDNTFRLSAAAHLPYRSVVTSFQGMVTVSPNAKLFIIPNQAEGSREAEFQIKGISDLRNDRQYTFEAYDANSVRTSAVFALRDYAMPMSSEVMLITGTARAINGDMAAAPALRGYLRGQEMTLTVDLCDDSPVQDIEILQKGDIVQFSYDFHGEVDYVKVVRSAGAEYALHGSVYAEESFAGGRVLAVDTKEKKVVIAYSADGSAAVYSIAGLSNVYLYHRKSGQFEIGSVAELMEGDLVFTAAPRLQCKELFIIQD